jgi:hypothetical protein
MKAILAFLAAFVVAAGASTGAKVMMAKPVHVAKADAGKEGVDSTATDSTARRTPETKTDSAHTPAHPAEPIRPSATEAMAKTPAFAASSTLVNNGPKPTAKPVAQAPAPAVASAPATDSVAEASERRLAKVFTAMEPKQAAKVLQHMQDSDVQIILGYVGPKQAATIMAELPPERVATLSKLAMQGKTK